MNLVTCFKFAPDSKDIQVKSDGSISVEQAEWVKPVKDDWVARVAEEVNAATRPVVLVAHSLGIPSAIHAIPLFRKPVAGAFFVAPPEINNPRIRPKHLMTFGPYPREPLPFPSLMIASRNDPFGDYAHADELAAAWGSLLIDAGEAGHINADSGIRDWPFGQFLLRQLRAAAEPANTPLLHGRNYATLRSQANSERPATG